MRKGKRVRFLEWLERRMYQAARHIVAVGTGYRDHIVRKVPQTRTSTSVITNGVDGTQFIPQGRSLDLVEQYELQEKFVCSYVGTVGMAHGLEVVIDAARRLRDAGRDEVRFLIVGGGARVDSLKRYAQEQDVAEMVRFTGRLDREAIPGVLATSDCCLIHLRGTELFGTVIPSKIFETMAMQRPIIMGVKGPARDIVMEAGAGVPMTPESAEELAAICTRLADDPEATEAMAATPGRMSWSITTGTIWQSVI